MSALIQKLRGKLGRLRRKLARRNAVILMYHRIADEGRDPWRLCVRPAHFAEHLAVLRSARVKVMPVSAIAEAMARGKRLHRVVGISFDDGYADNIHCALPLLESQNMPATLFVTAGYVGADVEFWWDALDRVLLGPHALPEELEVDLPDGPRRWSLGSAARWSAEDASSWPDWKPRRGGSPTPRHQAHDDLWTALVDMRAAERDGVIQTLFRWAGLDSAAPTDRRPALPEDLRAADRGGLLEIGAHGLTHCSLSDASPDEQRRELRESKARLETLLGHPVRGNSYPQGRLTETTQQEARDAGYAFACTSQPTVIDRNSDIFRIPRIVAPNIDGQGLAARLRDLGVI